MMTSEQLLCELAELGLFVLPGDRVSRGVVQAVFQWAPEQVSVLASRLDKLGIETPLKVPLTVNLSPALYRKFAIEQLKKQNPEIDWEAILPQVPKEAREKTHRIGAADDSFLNWLTPKYQADWKARGEPLLQKGLEEGALSTKDYNTISSILNKAMDGVRGKLRSLLKKVKGIYNYNNRDEFFAERGFKVKEDGTLSKEAWDAWTEYQDTPEYEAADKLNGIYDAGHIEERRSKVLEELKGWKKSVKNKEILAAIDLAIQYYNDFEGISKKLDGIEVLEASKMKYRPKRPKSGSLKEVHDLLEKAMADVRVECEKQWTDIIMGWATYWLEKKKEDPKLRFSKFYRGERASMTAKLLEGEYSSLRSDAKKIAAEQAKAVVKAMQDQFVGKNMGKLTPIIEGRGDFKEAKMLGGSTRAGAFEGSVLVEFQDGAQFTAITKLVFGMNQHGTSYMQYPTTFHDVEAPGQQSKKAAPEEWMNENFAKKTQ